VAAVISADTGADMAVMIAANSPVISNGAV